jgi:uncharacterized membrane protein
MNTKLKFAFLASLILNALLIGILVGQLPNRLTKNPSRKERMEQALKNLPEPVQTQFRSKMEQIRQVGKPLREQIRMARDDIMRILIAEPFDQAAYDRQVDTMNDLRMQGNKKMADIIKDLANELPSEHRNVLATILKRPPSLK